MTCVHADPCKEAKSPDPLGLPLDYMASHGIFEPKKTGEYDLCHFHQVGLSGNLPEFPLPHEPATCEQVSSLLLKARALGWLNLIVVHSRDVVTTVCLLQELHIKDSLCHLPGDQSRGWLQTHLEVFVLPFLPILQELRSILHESYCLLAL